jgi:protein-tyrosine kinase
MVLGKISDALEKHKKERVIPIEELRGDTPPRLATEDFRLQKPVRLKTGDPEVKLARQSSTDGKLSDSLVTLSSPDSADAENFKLLRSQILFPRGRQVPRCILVTSTFPGEGKTFVACNLAASLAVSVDESVLLVDADMRKSAIHRIFGLRNVLGLRDYLIGDKRFDEVVLKSGIEKLSIVLAGVIPPNPSELISSNMMARFLEDARTTYKDRFIIIDSPPAQIIPESKFLSNFVDGIIFVVLAQKTQRDDTLKAIEGLGRDKILGVVFNGYDQARKQYHKYYDQYYKRSR